MCPNAAKSARGWSGAAAAEPRTAEPGAAAERPVAGAEGPGVDGAKAPVGTDGSTGEGEQVGEKGEVSVQDGEVGEEEELGCCGAAEAVELMEQEAGWSPAPLRLRRSNRPGPVKAKKSRQTDSQLGKERGEERRERRGEERRGEGGEEEGGEAQSTEHRAQSTEHRNTHKNTLCNGSAGPEVIMQL
ncbi:hypothetical protein D4764_04G0013340 [Takifugu flavidus]|uniref:Uncharacterized protein n=1 Tax=Takifugu flavidus TaxID=433684 RepID=A0A5C6NAL8_9TELE|nr:hypothetical protein D4764_04G0013340 [Takifugu flavidus]